MGIGPAGSSRIGRGRGAGPQRSIWKPGTARPVRSRTAWRSRPPGGLCYALDGSDVPRRRARPACCPPPTAAPSRSTSWGVIELGAAEFAAAVAKRVPGARAGAGGGPAARARRVAGDRRTGNASTIAWTSIPPPATRCPAASPRSSGADARRRPASGTRPTVFHTVEKSHYRPIGIGQG